MSLPERWPGVLGKNVGLPFLRGLGQGLNFFKPVSLFLQWRWDGDGEVEWLLED